MWLVVGPLLLLIMSAEAPRLLPEADGAISQVRLHFTTDHESRLATVYPPLFAWLDPTVDIDVLTDSAAGVALFEERWGQRLRAAGRRLTVREAVGPITIWARDRWLARRGSAYIPDFPPEAITPAEANEISLGRQSEHIGRLPLAGGNVLAGRHQVWVGANLFSGVTEAHQPAMLEEMRAELGPPIIVSGQTKDTTPAAHLDMYVTIVSETTVLVADLRWGLRLLSSGPVRLSKAQSELADQFDAVAFSMTQAGLQVRRLPIHATRCGPAMLTYNNVVQEERGGRRRVLLPNYSIPSLDQAATAVYAELGYESSPVDLSRLAAEGGALRCLVNVTGRQSP